MQLELTDHLICPRCRPEQSLVLLIQEMTDRRVRRGRLGCPACRTDYPVEDGLADLRAERAAAPAPPEPFEADGLALRMAALVGLTAGPAFVYAAPRLAATAPAAADLVAGVEWVTAGGLAAEQPEGPGVSRLLFDGPLLPFASARIRGAALAEPEAAEVAEATRVLWPGAHLVLFAADERAREATDTAGLETVAREGGTWVLRRRFG